MPISISRELCLFQKSKQAGEVLRVGFNHKDRAQIEGIRQIYLNREHKSIAKLKVLAMETLEAIKTRRSIRKFKKDPISRDMVKELLEAAMFAPSAGNEQPWQFIVLDDRKILDDVPKICSTAAMCRQAATAILICGDAWLEKYPEFWVQDCSAAVENLLLAAHAMGLGAVWAGIYPLKDRVEGFRKLFSLSDNITPFALVPLGYPDQEIAPQKRFKEERIHYNGW